MIHRGTSSPCPRNKNCTEARGALLGAACARRRGQVIPSRGVRSEAHPHVSEQPGCNRWIAGEHTGPRETDDPPQNPSHPRNGRVSRPVGLAAHNRAWAVHTTTPRSSCGTAERKQNHARFCVPLSTFNTMTIGLHKPDCLPSLNRVKPLYTCCRRVL